MQRARRQEIRSLKPKCPAGFPRDEEGFVWPKGEVTIALVAPGVVVGSSRGVMTLEAGAFLRGYLSRHIAKLSAEAPPLRLFADDRLVQRADPEYREIMAAWVKENKRAIAEINILTDSRLFAMAVTVGRLIVGGVLDSWSDARAFEAALEKAIEERS